MIVRIINGAGESIWERDEQRSRGMTSRAYAADGTLEEIIRALKDALRQAEGELLTFDVVDRVPDVSSTAP